MTCELIRKGMAAGIGHYTAKGRQPILNEAGYR